MQELVKAIQNQGIGIGTDIVKVDMLINHRIDTELMMHMGQAFANAFADEKPEVVLTVEASGIAIALATAVALGSIPVVFAKKSQSRNTGNDVYEAPVFSYTHGVMNHVRIDRKYLSKGTRALIIDDFLATGAAAMGLIDICHQAGAVPVGIGMCVEKSFQSGRKAMEDMGIKVVTLARVTAIEDGKLTVTD